MKISKNSKGVGWEKEDGETVDLSSYAKKTDLPTNASQLQNVIYVAHRGYSSGAPENTIPAYELAAKLGYMIVEADICETSDGNFILMHDETVDNMTNGTGNIKNLTLEQIKALTIDNGNGIENYPNLKVPTLQEFLQVCRKYSLTPVLDIRPFTNYENFLNIIIEEGFEYSCIILDTFINQLKHIRSLNTNVSLMSLAEISIEDCLKYNIGIDLLYTHEWMTETNIKNAIDNGIEVGIWTVNSKSIAERFIGYGVRYLTTDQLQLDSTPGFRVHELETNFDALEERVTNPYFIESPLELKYISDTVVGVHTLSFAEGTGTNYYPDNFKIYSDSKGRALSEAIPAQGCYNVNVHFDTNFKVTIYCYNKDNKFIQDLGWFTSDVDKQLPITTKFYQIYAAKVDGTLFTSDDLNTLAKSIRITYLKNDTNNNCISYATNASVDEKIANISTGGSVDLSSYAKKTDLPTKTSQLTNDSGFITSIPSEYITESELNAKGYLTEVPSEYITETELELELYQPKQDNTLNTENKTIVGAINELDSKVLTSANIYFNSSGELVVTIDGMTKTFVPKE